MFCKIDCLLKLLCRPGMNRCDVSEEETTKALNALYQLPPAPENQLPHGVPAAGIQPLDSTQHGFSVGKKKLKQKKPLNPTTNAYQMDLSNSTKMTSKASLKSRSLHDPIKSSLESNLANFHQSSKSNDIDIETRCHEQKCVCNI